MSNVAEAWWSYVAHATWQSALLGVALLALAWVLRRRPASLRYGLLLVALLKFAVPPMMAFPTGAFSRPEVAAVAAPGGPHVTEFWSAPDTAAVPGPTETARAPGPEQPRPVATPMAVETPAPRVQEEVVVAAPPTTSAPTVVASPGPAPSLPACMTWKAILLMVHVAGSAAIAAWVARACWAIRSLTRRSTEVSDGPLHALLASLAERLGLRRDVRLLLAPPGTPPMAFGMLRPTVVLPENLTEQLSGDKLTALLAHELAHHRRRDPLFMVLENVLLLAWWFNPVLWLVLKGVRRAREDCCDDLVLAHSIADNETYCDSLMSAASAVTAPSPVGAALGFTDRLHPLGHRMRRIMDATIRRPRRLSLAGVVAVVMLGLVALPGLRMVSAEDELTKGLVAYYPFDGDARDASGNGNHGVASGVSATTDRFGNADSALHFSGNGSGVECPSSDSLNIHGRSSLTIGAWIRAEQNNVGRHQGLVWKWGRGMAKDDQFVFALQNQGAYFGLSDIPSRVTSGPLPVGEWFSLVGVYDAEGKRLKLYVNGELETTKRLDSVIRSTTQPLYLGKAETRRSFFAGDLDEVRIYSRALKGDEIGETYGGPPPKRPQLTVDALPSREKRETDAGARRVTVPAKQAPGEEWHATGVTLRSGAKVAFSASGTVKWDPGLPSVTPQGAGRTPLGSTGRPHEFLAPSAPCGGLVGRIGEGGEPFFIGESCTMAATNDGDLYLGVNDRVPHFMDNEGEFDVEITVREGVAETPGGLSLLKSMTPAGGCTKEKRDGHFVLTAPRGEQGLIQTEEAFRPPFRVKTRAMTDSTNIRLFYCGTRGVVILNWEYQGRLDELRIHHPAKRALVAGVWPAKEGKKHNGYITPNEWHDIEWEIRTDSMRVVVDGEERFAGEVDCSTCDGTLGIGPTWLNTVSVESFVVEQLPGSTLATGSHTGVPKDGLGPQGGVLRFDGKDDFIHIPPAPQLDLKGDMTVSAWVKVDPDCRDSAVFRRGDAQPAHDPYSLGAHPGQMAFDVGGGRGNTPDVARAAADLDEEWHFWTGVRDTKAGKLRLYKDGESMKEVADALPYQYPTSKMYNELGACDAGRWGPWGYFKGEIDQVSVWNVPLKPEQVRALFAQGASGDEPGLAGLWLFDGEGQTVRDSSPHNLASHLGKTPDQDASDPARVRAGAAPERPEQATSAVIAPPPPLTATEVPGTLVFQGRYRHRSRGHDMSEPSTLWLKQQEDGAVTAVTHLPALGSMFVARGDANGRLVAYSTGSEASGEETVYSSTLKFEGGKAIVMRRGIREDWDEKELTIPAGAVFDPNSRPDPYCAAHILLRGINLAEGESLEAEVCDWDNTGDALAAYTIQIKHAGREEVTVPAGTFLANHIVVTQLTSANTWFKKRAGHVTDCWALDNGVIVRILRHREPYEVQLLDWSVPAGLEGCQGLEPRAPEVSSEDAAKLSDEELRELVSSDNHACRESRQRRRRSLFYLDANWRERMPIWEEAAKRGIPEGQVLVGLCHGYGVGVEKDPVKEAELMLAAAEQGEPAAMFNLAQAYTTGNGMGKDTEEGLSWYRKAADLGDSGAMWHLGWLCQRGRYLPQDSAKAVEWFRKSAESGSARGMMLLSECYMAGDGVEKDESKGLEWVRKAADLDYERAKARLGQLESASEEEE
jgi:beta-lactamase regulating signal transducer with metallopeptidase domain